MLIFLLGIGSIIPADMRENAEKLQKFIVEKEAKLYMEHPEYRKFMSVPDLKFLKRMRMRKAEVETINVAVLRVEFLEDTTSLTTGNGKMQLEPFGYPCDTVITWNEDSTEADTQYVRNLYYDPPHDSIYFHHLMEYLHNYYWSVTHGKLFIKWDVLPKSLDSSFTVPHKMTYYGDPENYVLGLFSLLRDAIEVADPTVDFSQYDRIIIFHAGSMWQTDMGDSPYDLPAVFIDGADQLFDSPIIADGDSITGGVIYCETGFQDNMAAFLQGGLCHEFCHALGAIDLYDTSGRSMGLGGWGLMGTGNWNELGLVPPRVSAWHRYYLGFEEPVVIDHDTTGVEIHWNGAEDSNAVRLIKIPINKYEYYLIENRYVYINPDTVHYVNPCTTSIDSNGARVWKDNVLVKVDDYESSLPPDLYKGGLAIWHIDERKIADSIDYNAVNSGWPKGIDMEEADGIQDFEMSFMDMSIIDINALYYGSPLDVFARDAFLDSFTPNSEPNTNDNFGNRTYIRITNISESGPVMTFDIHFDRRLNNFPVDLGFPTDVVSPVPYDSLILCGTLDGGVYLISMDGITRRVFQMPESSYTIPAVYDVNSDGIKEIITGDTGGNLYILEPDSTVLDSFKFRRIVGSPLVVDMDGDGHAEIVIGSDDSKIHIIHTLNDSIIDVYLGQWIWTVPLFVNGYIYVVSDDGTLFKLTPDGKIVWRRGEESLTFTTSSPVACDIDRDGKVEIIYSAGRRVVYCIDEDGNREWEYSIPERTFFSSPAIGDVNGDGWPEFVFASGKKIYALDKNGFPLNGFPVDMRFSEEIQSSIILYDVDGDSMPEIIFGSPDGGIYGLKGDGKIHRYFPLTTGMRVYSTPYLFEKNDSLILMSTSDDGYLYGWYLGQNPSGGFNYPQIYLNPQHNAFVDISLIPQPVSGSITSISALVPEREFYIYPSPVNGTKGTLRYFVGDDVSGLIVNLKIFSVSGRRIFTRTDVNPEYGYHEYNIDFSRYGDGIYIAQLVAEWNGEKIVLNKRFGVLKGGY